MISNPTVSVVIPAYRAARTIQRAVESALRQTSPPNEVLVVDDGSPDGVELEAALRPFGDAVSLLRKPNGGAASARNHGIDRARHDWIAFLDADDYWEASKLERQLAVVREHPELGLVACRWYEQFPGEPRYAAPVDSLRYCGRPLRVRGRDAFEVALVIWTGSLLIRRGALGTERFISGLEPAEDRDLWVRLLATHTAYILPELLATYVQEPGGISRVDIDKDCGSMLQVVHRHASLLGPSGVRRQSAVVFRRWAGVHLAQGRPAHALPRAIRRLRLQPHSAQAWWIVTRSAWSAMSQRARRQ